MMKLAQSDYADAPIGEARAAPVSVHAAARAKVSRSPLIPGAVQSAEAALRAAEQAFADAQVEFQRLASNAAEIDQAIAEHGEAAPGSGEKDVESLAQAIAADPTKVFGKGGWRRPTSPEERETRHSWEMDRQVLLQARARVEDLSAAAAGAIAEAAESVDLAYIAFVHVARKAFLREFEAAAERLWSEAWEPYAALAQARTPHSRVEIGMTADPETGVHRFLMRDLSKLRIDARGPDGLPTPQTRSWPPRDASDRNEVIARVRSKIRAAGTITEGTK